jgi:hypothetical protein
MAVNYKWVIEQMTCYPTYEEQTDVVFTVYWRVNATENGFTASNYGSQGVEYVAGSPYTPYAQLTQDQVVNWVQTAMGQKMVESILANLATNLQNQINPPVVTPPLPWPTV